MILLFIFLLFYIEVKWSPRLAFVKESSVLLFFYWAKNGVRKSIIFKI